MKKTAILICLLTAGATLTAAQAEPVADDALGLSKTSVFDVPAPSAYDFSGSAPGAGNELFIRSYDQAPPQIPHSVVGLLPVTMQNNMCVGCHVQPGMLGKEVVKGMPVPVPASHYEKPAFGKAEAGLDPGKKDQQLSGSRFVCTQCHAPQAKVDPLVQSNFDTAFRKRNQK